MRNGEIVEKELEKGLWVGVEFFMELVFGFSLLAVVICGRGKI